MDTSLVRGIDAFWSDVVLKIPLFNPSTGEPGKEQGTNIVKNWSQLLKVVNNSLTCRLGVSSLCMGRYHFLGPEGFSGFIKGYADKMMVMLFDLEITAEGESSAFEFVSRVCARAPPLPDEWRIIRFVPIHLDDKKPNRSIELELQRGNFVMLPDDFRFNLTKFSDAGSIPESDSKLVAKIMASRTPYNLTADHVFDLIIIVNDKIRLLITSQDDADALKNSVIDWLVGAVGEYYTALCIPALTIVPEQFIRERPGLVPLRLLLDTGVLHDGTLLLEELRTAIIPSPKLHPETVCKFCGLLAHNVDLELIHDRHETFELQKYPYIRGILCKYCIKLLKNFLSLYSSLRVKFARA